MDAQVARREFVKRLAEVMLEMEDLSKLLHSLTQMVVEVFEVAWATISVLDETSGQYTLKAQSRRENLDQDRTPTIDEAGPWLKDRQKILRQRLLEEIGAQMTTELRLELNKADTFVSMPLFYGRQLMGVLNLGAKAGDAFFTQEELTMLAELAELLAPIIHQGLRYHNVSQQRLHHQNILDNLVSGIVAIDPEDKLTVFNRTAERILKVTAEQVLGKDVRILQANLANLLLDTLHKDRSFRREELFIQPENVLIGVSTSQFYDAKGRLLGACMVFSSIAEIKRKEELTRRQIQDGYWSNVATFLAHEVKNSIVATKVFAEMFPKKYEDAEFRWNLYSTLRRDMDKLDKFSEKMIDFAQSPPPAWQSCHLDKVIDAAINSAFQERAIGAIVLQKRYSPELRPLTGDYHQLKEAVTQIIRNALEAMGETGTLSISMAMERGPEMLMFDLPQAQSELPQTEIAVVKITDTGAGIPEEDLPYLFDPFFTTKEARTGLGLASARKIIERHHGIIKAESKPGEGTTFWVCLPIVKEGVS